MSTPNTDAPPPRGEPRGETPPWSYVRPIWELELLISGAVIFSLFQLPSLLTRSYLALELHVSSRLFLLPFMFYYVLLLVIIALILAFSAHFFLRGFWVALCGLNAVFPDGIRWDRYDAGPVAKRVYRELLPDPRDLERRVDRLAGTVFSVLFLALLAMFFALLWVTGLAVVATVATRLINPDASPLIAFYVLLVLAMSPVLAAGAVDQWFKKEPEREQRHPRLRGLAERVLRGYQRVTFGRAYNPILLVFASHFSSRKATAASMLASLGLAFLFLAYFTVRVGLFGFDSYVYFPSRSGPATMDARHYESLAPADDLGRVPTIQSDVVEGPYLRLFIPYLPDRDRELVEERCPEVAPLRGEGLFFAKRRRGEPEQVEALAGCLARVYRLVLNGREIDEPGPTFYRRPSDGVAGVVIYLPTAELPAGRNLLEVVRVRSEEDSGTEREDGEDDGPDRHHYFIPFWR